jgi:hypothetical protein
LTEAVLMMALPGFMRDGRLGQVEHGVDVDEGQLPLFVRDIVDVLKLAW